MADATLESRQALYGMVQNYALDAQHDAGLLVAELRDSNKHPLDMLETIARIETKLAIVKAQMQAQITAETAALLTTKLVRR